MRKVYLLLCLLISMISPLAAQNEAQFPDFWLYWSPSGNQAAVVFLDEVRIYDRQFADFVVLPIGLPDKDLVIFNLAWNPLGSHLGVTAQIGYDKYVQIWETESFQLVSQLQDNELSIRQMQWSPDGEEYAVIYGRSNIHIYDAHLAELVSSIMPLEEATIQQIAWNPVKAEIAIGIGTSIYFWDVSSNSQNAKIDNDFNPSTKMAFSPDGEYLAGVSIAMGAPYDELVIWDVDTLQTTWLLSGHSATIYDFAWANPNRIATVSFDRTIRIWNISTEQTILTINVPLIHQLEWYPDEETLFVNGFDSTETLTNIITGESLAYEFPN
jgi:WD40 repeat protein